MATLQISGEKNMNDWPLQSSNMNRKTSAKGMLIFSRSAKFSFSGINILLIGVGRKLYDFEIIKVMEN